MDAALPIVFLAIMGLSLVLYVILDGYDLGIGLLLPLASDREKDTMIAAIGPFWDANETWLVLGVGVLLIAFPSAHALVLTSLYIPVTIMLFGLILRGVSFDFRVKAASHQKRMWNRAFAGGSLIAAVAQGWMLGSYITGLTPSAVNFAFSVLIAATMPALYVVLGAGWLLLKTEGELFDKALAWGRRAMPDHGPRARRDLDLDAARQRDDQGGLVQPAELHRPACRFRSRRSSRSAPCTGCCTGATLALAGYAWIVLGGTVLMCVMAALGLAYSLYPVHRPRPLDDLGSGRGAELAEVRVRRRRNRAAVHDRVHDLRLPHLPRQSDGLSYGDPH